MLGKTHKWFIILLACLCLPLLTPAHTNDTGGDNEICNEQEVETLPKVFLIGEHEDEYVKASEIYRMQLLEVCNDDMNTAFLKWISMLQEMESYAADIGIDLKGVKIWIKVFWAEDGSIDHIAYYLKPNCRNINVDELTAFFMSFMNNYQFPLITNKKYSHYGSASFPTRFVSADSN